MPRLRHQPRIRPVHLRRSRRRSAVVVLAGLVAVAGLGTMVSSRQAERVVELDASGPYRVLSSAGPVEVGLGDAPRLVYRASWLLRGPSVSDDPWPGRLPAADLSLACGRRLPCRAVGRVELPPDAELEVRTTGGDVLVSSFAGSVNAITTGTDEVVVGPMEGVLRIETERGAVVGHGLAVTEVEVRTAAGEVRLAFRERPRSVRVEAGEAPVTLELPPGRYAVSVEGDLAPTIGVDVDGTADSRITVDGRGPVRIRHST